LSLGDTQNCDLAQPSYSLSPNKHKPTLQKKQDSTERYESDKKEIVSTLAIATCLEK
jgi:hypothetical protein